jgi:hypothetical protein
MRLRFRLYRCHCWTAAHESVRVTQLTNECYISAPRRTRPADPAVSSRSETRRYPITASSTMKPRVRRTRIRLPGFAADRAAEFFVNSLPDVYFDIRTGQWSESTAAAWEGAYRSARWWPHRPLSTSRHEGEERRVPRRIVLNAGGSRFT